MFLAPQGNEDVSQIREAREDTRPAADVDVMSGVPGICPLIPRSRPLFMSPLVFVSTKISRGSLGIIGDFPEYRVPLLFCEW